MLPLDDERWSALDGGYRVPYDPRPALARLAAHDDSAWDELWQELHHQDDIGLASYAAVPRLVALHRARDVPDWQTYALVGQIELCRHHADNPPLPAWLAGDYHAAWQDLFAQACRDLVRASDQTTVRSILGVMALAKDLRSFGELALHFGDEELAEFIKG